jgi:protein TorT
MDRIKINRLSKLARRMNPDYGQGRRGAIAVVALMLLTVFSSLTANTTRASEDLVFCVLVPHFKDEYWLSVAFGLEQEAEHHDIHLRMLEAGGYQSRAQQIAQLHTCADDGVNAVLLGAVTSDHPTILQAISDLSPRLPIFGLVNELHSDALRGAVGVDWYDMGLVLGHYLTEHYSAAASSHRAALLSGPTESGWAPPLEQGLRDGLAASGVSLERVLAADTGLRQQLQLVDSAMADSDDFDLLIGSAPAIEAAMGLMANRSTTQRPVLASTYISHTVTRGLLNGAVLAAPFDDPMLQGRMAIEQALEFLATGQTQPLIGPDIVLLDGETIRLADIDMSPSDYFPTIE